MKIPDSTYIVDRYYLNIVWMRPLSMNFKRCDFGSQLISVVIENLGLRAHTDPGAFTTPLQDLGGPGLQDFKDGKWELGLQVLKDGKWELCLRVLLKDGKWVAVKSHPEVPDAIIFFGIDRDTDRDAFTTPLQDLQVAGLQDVKPHPGAFVIKIGDQLQVKLTKLFYILIFSYRIN